MNDVVRLRPIAAAAETGQIAAGVGSGSYRLKSITHCLQFAFQQARRGAMLFCWTIGVEVDHFSRPFQGRRSEEPTSELQSLMRISSSLSSLTSSNTHQRLAH